jgi:hypothetical protein
VLHTIPLVHSALDGISIVTSTGATIPITTIVPTSTRPVQPTVHRGRWPPNLASSPGGADLLKTSPVNGDPGAWQRRWQICTALPLGKLMFQIGDSFLGVVLVHQQMVPPGSRAGQEVADARQDERSPALPPRPNYGRIA